VVCPEYAATLRPCSSRKPATRSVSATVSTYTMPEPGSDLLGFAAAIAVTFVAALVARTLGWLTAADVVGPRPETRSIYTRTSGRSWWP
jgi:hypothetical protein